MKFADPIYLNLLWLLLPLALFLRWAWKQRLAALDRFGQREMIERLTAGVSRTKQKTKLVLMFGVFLFALVALARPLWGAKEQTLISRGHDVIIALDVSRSMLAEDIQPNRLERAKFEIGKLIEMLEGNRVGIIPFAGEAFVQCPLTLDQAAARILLNEISIDSVPVGGTAITRAINKALETFPEGYRESRVIILITDGEDTQDDPMTAAQIAKDNGILIYAMGIGDPLGVPIPLRNPEDGSLIDYVKDEEGRVVSTKLDEDTLKQICIETGGAYFPVRQADFGMAEMIDHMEQRRQERELDERFTSQYEERYGFFLVPAFILLLIEMLLSERKTKRKTILSKPAPEGSS